MINHQRFTLGVDHFAVTKPLLKRRGLGLSGAESDRRLGQQVLQAALSQVGFERGLALYNPLFAVSVGEPVRAIGHGLTA